MTYYVDNETDFTNALASPDSNIDIVVTGSFTLTATKTPASGKNVTITSGPGGPYTITRGVGGNLFRIYANTSLTFSSIILDGNKGAYVKVGSLIYCYSGTVTLGNGAILQNNSGLSPDASGGVYTQFGTINMESGSIIRNNDVTGDGGGIRNNAGTVNMRPGSVITGNTATGGGGGITCVNSTAHLNVNGGEISNNKAQIGGGVYTTGRAVMHFTDALISGNESRTLGGGIVCSSLDPTVIDGNTRIVNNKAGTEGGGLYQECAYLKNVDIGPDVVFAGNSAQYAYEHDSAFDAVYNAHVLATHWTAPFDYGYNGYDIYGCNTVRIIVTKPSAQKTLSGDAATLTAGQFTFGLYDKDNALIATATNDASGVIEFPILMKGDDTGNYSIREITPSGNGWIINNAKTYPVQVTTTCCVSSIIYPEGPPVFDNRYTAAPGSASLVAKKYAQGSLLPGGRFNFGLYDSNSNLVDTATADASGNIAFNPLDFNTTGAYAYTIREISQDGGGWLVDPSAYPATVTVTDNGLGQLVTSVNYGPGGVPQFTNTFNPKPTSQKIVAYKQLQGWGAAEKAFQFGLFDENGIQIATAQNVNGIVEFPELPYTALGTHQYTVRELSQSGDGWTADGTAFPVTVAVIDDGTGELIAQVTYPNGQPNFVNSYTAQPTQATLAAGKSVAGAPLGDGQFTFTVFDENGTPIAADTNDANGRIAFPSIGYTEPGTYTYTIRETAGNGNGWTLDEHVYTAVVTVADNGAGQLVSSVQYPKGTPNFVNNFAIIPADVSFSAKKSTVGAPQTPGQFQFTLYDADGVAVGTGANDANGDVLFPDVRLSEPGQYGFTIRETTVSGNGWTVDGRSYPADVKVIFSGDNELAAEVTYPNGNPNFVNTYEPDPSSVAVSLGANKSAVGAPLAAGMFQFAFYNQDGTVAASASNDADGTVTFPPLIFTQPGIYTGTIRETMSPDGWTTDPAACPVTIVVTRGVDGRLVANTQYGCGAPDFVNTFAETPPPPPPPPPPPCPPPCKPCCRSCPPRCCAQMRRCCCRRLR